MTQTQEWQVTVNQYAERVIAGMREDLAALKHSGECSEGDECKAGAESENPEHWHDEDAAREHIEETPLSIEVRSGWHTPGTDAQDTEYNILLGTGGPASRIVGEIDDNGESATATFEFQDWGKPWTAANLTQADEDTLLKWVQVFYLGA